MQTSFHGSRHTTPFGEGPERECISVRCGAYAALDMQRVAREREQLLAHAQQQLARTAEQQLQARHAPAAADSAAAAPAEAMQLQIALMQQQVAALQQRQQQQQMHPEPMQVRRPCFWSPSWREAPSKSSFPQA